MSTGKSVRELPGMWRKTIYLVTDVLSHCESREQKVEKVQFLLYAYKDHGPRAVCQK